MSEEQFNEISGIHARLLSLDEGAREAVLRELRRTSDCFISLEAAASCGTTVECLLKAAIAREIELLFEAHPQVQLVLHPAKRLPALLSIGTPNPFRTPEYLVVEPRWCEVLLRKEFVFVDEATVGYRHTGSPYTLLVPCDACKADGLISPVQIKGVDSPSQEEGRWAKWGFQVNGAPFLHPLPRERVLLRASHFFHWMGWMIDPVPDPLYLPSHPDQRSPGPRRNVDYISPQLARMAEAAERFWSNAKVTPDKLSTHPSDESVKAWFLKTGDGFSEHSAREAVRLIKPSWAHKAGRPAKEK